MAFLASKKQKKPAASHGRACLQEQKKPAASHGRLVYRNRRNPLPYTDVLVYRNRRNPLPHTDVLVYRNRRNPLPHTDVLVYRNRRDPLPHTDVLVYRNRRNPTCLSTGTEETRCLTRTYLSTGASVCMYQFRLQFQDQLLKFSLKMKYHCTPSVIRTGEIQRGTVSFISLPLIPFISVSHTFLTTPPYFLSLICHVRTVH